MATIAVTIQQADLNPPEIDVINDLKEVYDQSSHPKLYITSHPDYLEDLYRGEVYPSNASGYEAVPIAYELKTDQLTQTYINDAIPIYLPAEESTNEQLRNLQVTLGISREMLSLQGVLVDRGSPTANNLTKHVFLNIARKQWGQIIQNAANPLSYPRLTLNSGYDIFETNMYDSDTDLDNDADRLESGSYIRGEHDGGFPKYYRGIITNLTFTLQGGRPDIFTWRMEFAAIKNENFYRRLE